MARGTVLQMVKTTHQDKEILGYYRECSSNTDKCRYHHLLFGDYYTI